MNRETIVKATAGVWAGIAILHAGAAINNEEYARVVADRIADFNERNIRGHFSTMNSQEQSYRDASEEYWDKFLVDGFMVVASLAGGTIAARRSRT